jgi:hypothetical protein
MGEKTWWILFFSNWNFFHFVLNTLGSRGAGSCATSAALRRSRSGTCGSTSSPPTRTCATPARSAPPHSRQREIFTERRDLRLFSSLFHTYSIPHRFRPLALSTCNLHKRWVVGAINSSVVVQIRIRLIRASDQANGSGSGSCYFPPWPSRCQQKTFFLSYFAYYFLKVHLRNFS